MKVALCHKARVKHTGTSTCTGWYLLSLCVCSSVRLLGVWGTRWVSWRERLERRPPGTPSTATNSSTAGIGLTRAWKHDFSKSRSNSDSVYYISARGMACCFPEQCACVWLKMHLYQRSHKLDTHTHTHTHTQAHTCISPRFPLLSVLRLFISWSDQWTATTRHFSRKRNTKVRETKYTTQWYVHIYTFPSLSLSLSLSPSLSLSVSLRYESTWPESSWIYKVSTVCTIYVHR